MTAKIIDGNAIAKQVRAEWKVRVDHMRSEGLQPGLAVIIAGSNAASKVYVRNKAKACETVGVHSEIHEFPDDVTEQTLLDAIDSLNANPKIHGILVQLPLPAHLNSHKVLEQISVDKDVDGFHLYNVGALVVGNSIFPPCTPYGVQVMLEHENIPIWGQNVVVVGASNIVGKPMAMMLLQKGATVTICNSKTRDLAAHTLMADILIVAAGRPGLVTPQMVKKGATVIDVGINRLPDGTLAGDIDFAGVCERAAYVTPVPGGVGPMTVTMLICNTVEAAERARSRQGLALTQTA